MNFDYFIWVALYFGLTYFIAKFIGTHRQIGYSKSIYWSILLTPIIGLIVTLSSKKLRKRSI